MTRDEIVNLFMENAAKAAAETFKVSGPEGLKQVVAEITKGNSPIYCAAVTENEKAAAIPPEVLTDDFFTAAVSVEEVFGAIAETGSLICSSEGGKPVQGGLLPSHHIAIVAAENIFPELEDFFGTRTLPLPANITLETGPSRTADIELTLTIGVHGPERLSIIVV